MWCAKSLGSVFIVLWFVLGCAGKTTEEMLDAKFMGSPVVSPAYPTNGATDVAVSPRILFTSTQKLKLESLSTGVELKQGATNIAFTVVAVSDNVYELTPTVSLTGGSSHVIRYTKGIVSVFGSSPAGDTEVGFTTLDVDAPAVQTHNVANLAEGTTSVNISITFNKSVTGVALSASSITVTAANGCMNCASASALAGSGAGPYTFQISNLTTFTTYQVNLGNQIKNASGISLQPVTYEFTVGPRVTSAMTAGSQGVFTTGWNSQDLPPLVQADNSGNVYVSGLYTGTSTLGGTVVTTSYVAIYLVKLDAANNFLWQRIFNIGSSANHIVHRMLLTPTGPVISGRYTGDHNFGTGLLGHVGAATDGFIVKLNPADGTTAWSARWASSHGDSNDSITVLGYDPAGYILARADVNGSLDENYILTGSISGGCPSGIGNGTAISLANSLQLLAFNESTGACAWSHTLSLSHDIYDIAIAGGYMYMTGVFSSNGSPCCGLPSLTHSGSGDAYVARAQLNGAAAPSATGGFVRAMGIAGATEAGWHLALDTGNSRIYVAGNTNTTTNLGCSPTACASVGNAGGRDTFVAQLPLTGGAPTWAVGIGGPANDYASGIFFANGRVRLLVDYDTTFSNTAATFGCASFKGFGLRDLLLVSLSSTGTIEGGRFFGAPYDDKTFSGRPFSQTSAGSLFMGLNMASGKIGNFDVANVTSQPGIVFWKME